MVHSTYGIRLIIELIAGVLLLAFIVGVMLFAAIVVGWAMALGMMIVFVLEAIKMIKSHSL